MKSTTPQPTRGFSSIIVVLMLLLQGLSPLLHAHERGEAGEQTGLHLHLGKHSDAIVADRRSAQDADHHRAPCEPQLVNYSATADEGAVVFLSSEYRRDSDPLSIGNLPPPGPVSIRVDAIAIVIGHVACRSSFIRFAGRDSHLTPPATAPPQA